MTNLIDAGPVSRIRLCRCEQCALDNMEIFPASARPERMAKDIRRMPASFTKALLAIMEYSRLVQWASRSATPYLPTRYVASLQSFRSAVISILTPGFFSDRLSPFVRVLRVISERLQGRYNLAVPRPAGQGAADAGNDLPLSVQGQVCD